MSLVVIYWIDIFCQSFSVVAPLTKRLHIALIPEKFLIATMRDNMIHHCCFRIFALLHAFNTKRVCLQICLTELFPSFVINLLMLIDLTQQATIS